MSAALAEALDLFDPDVVEDATPTERPLRLVTHRNPGSIEDQVIFNWPFLYVIWP